MKLDGNNINDDDRHSKETKKDDFNFCSAFVAIHCTFVSSSIKDFLLVLKWRSTVSIRRLGGQIYHLLRSIS